MGTCFTPLPIRVPGVLSVPGRATLQFALFLDTELAYISNCSSWKIGTAYHIASTPWLPMTCDATNEGISSQGIHRIFPERSCPASTKLPKCSAHCILFDLCDLEKFQNDLNERRVNNFGLMIRHVKGQSLVNRSKSQRVMITWQSVHLVLHIIYGNISVDEIF